MLVLGVKHLAHRTAWVSFLMATGFLWRQWPNRKQGKPHYHYDPTSEVMHHNFWNICSVSKISELQEHTFQEVNKLLQAILEKSQHNQIYKSHHHTVPFLPLSLSQQSLYCHPPDSLRRDFWHHCFLGCSRVPDHVHLKCAFCTVDSLFFLRVISIFSIQTTHSLTNLYSLWMEANLFTREGLALWGGE